MAGRGGQGGGRQGAGASGRNNPRPVRGRPSPAVYRRRRLLVGGVLVLVLLLIGGGAWALVRGAGHSTAADRAAQDAGPVGASETASPAASSADAGASPTASSTPSDAPTPTCDPNKISVSASTDKRVYSPTENPVLTLKVTNQNAIPCPMNVGTSQMEYLIVSGADRVFDSKDCQTGVSNLTKTIAPGASETANFPWSRVRSTEGCKAITVKPLPGTYVLTTSLGSLQSSKAVFTLQ